MAKNFTASEDQLQPDAKYGSLLVSKFVNCMMRDGKKSVAIRVFYDALDIIKKKLPETSELEVFQHAVDNVKPSIEVRSKRVGGATYRFRLRSALGVSGHSRFAGFSKPVADARGAASPLLSPKNSWPPTSGKGLP